MLAHGRRQKIRAPRKSSSNVDFDTMWNGRLAPAIKEIQNKNSSELSFETLYSTVYSLVLAKHGKALYEMVRKAIKTRLDDEIVPSIVPMLVESNSINVLKEIQKIWQDHCLSGRLISDIVMYLDRVYSRESQLPLVYDSAMLLFRDAFLRNSSYPIADYIYQTIIDKVQKERGGEIIDRQTLKATISMLESLPWGDRINSASIYTVEFEPLLNSAAEEYYKKVASNLVNECNSIGSYLIKIKQLLDDETTRDSMYLPESTCILLLPTAQKALIHDHIEEVISNPNHGFSHICDEGRFEDLSLLYDMVHLVDESHECIKNALSAKVLAVGNDINNMAQKLTEEAKAAKSAGNKEKSAKLTPTSVAISWVSKMIAFRNKYKKIQQECFRADRHLETVQEDAMSKVINQDNKVSEYLSLFIDDNLKKSMKGKTDEEIEEILHEAIGLFKFIADKDFFESYYKNHLARRLLSGKTISDDAEKSFVGQIKKEVGMSFTAKMEGMFKDMKISTETMTKFRLEQQDLGRIHVLPLDLNVKILTSTYWPNALTSSAAVSCRLPQNLESAKSKFEDFYLSIHTGRVLSWNLTLGTVDVRARFKKRTHEINMPTLAATILFLFNDLEEGATMSYDEIRSLTNIPYNELNRHLLSISVAPRTRLLVKDPMSKDIKSTDRFSINEKFESPMIKLKVLAVSASNKAETEQERKNTVDKVMETRKYEIDAAVVRVMKTRKTMEHALLIAEVTQQLTSRFRPDPASIKRQIDSLMDREYLERDPEQRNTYRYLA